jgi:4-hydroxybenzoate polyprenyltransferase
MRALLGAAHPGPALAVTIVAGLLAVAGGVSVVGASLVVLAVLAGQLSIGWSNDLLDLARDRAVGRTDKPLAAGAVRESTVRTACALALVVTVPASLVTGVVAGLFQLVLVASGWGYNLGLKATAWSWLPYAVGFAALPTYVWLLADAADTTGALAAPPWWVPATGGLLGVGAHFLNVLPDLADDAATGVRGLPHRLGARGAQVTAAVLLLAAAGCLLVGADLPAAATAVAGAATLVLAVVAVTARGRAPFQAAVGLALVDVVVLVWAR